MRTYRSVATAYPDADDAPAPTGDVVSAYAAALNCLLGGAGLAAIILAASFAFGLYYTGLMAAILAGVAFTGILAVWWVLRPIADTEWQLWRGRQAERRLAQAEAQRDLALQQRDAANEAARQWRDHHDILSRQQQARTFVAPTPPPDDPVQRDALTLIIRRYRRNEPVSRRYMAGLKWDAARYNAAADLLRGRGFFVGNQWKSMTEQEAITLLGRKP
jgi:signal transduction histidine kinase